jgi:hypothetical protein
VRRLSVRQHERDVRKDARYGPITVHAIASVRYRSRDTWTEEGDKIPVSKNSPAKPE